MFDLVKSPLEKSIVMPVEWGAKIDSTRKWADDKDYRPVRTIIHYNGGAVPAGVAPYSQEAEMHWLRQAESWHLNPNRAYGPMRAIGYNLCIGQTGILYWGRGPFHANGGQFEPHNSTSRTVAFILGGNQQPSMPARLTFGRLFVEEPLNGQVWGHRDVAKTSCPGDPLYEWLVRGGWVDDMGLLAQGDVDPTVSSIKVRLHRLGYRRFPLYGPVFGADLRRQVQRFQTRHGLRPDGVVGPQTFLTLGGLKGEVFPDDHSQEPV